MIKFLLKGILRDKNRSLLPIVIISIGVTLTILLSGFMKGVMGDIIDQSARFDTGHVKVMTNAYANDIDQIPNDLAIIGISDVVTKLQTEFPEVNWVKRIKFGGLIDVPDENGLTRTQGPATGMAIDFFDSNNGEVERLNIRNSLKSGNLPSKKEDALIGHEFAQKLKIGIGDKITYVGSTVNGSMSFMTFTVVGTVTFGTSALDRGAVIVDISDVQQMLDMADGTSELLGFFDDGVYIDEKAQKISKQFNQKYSDVNNEFSLVMQPLKEQNNLASYIDYVDSFSALFIIIFVIAMSVVLWNTGLLGGLRRYQEFGIRLALGEEKSHIYRSLVMEAVLTGTIGSLIGTTIGVSATFFLQVYGIDIGSMMSNSTMLVPSVMRAKLTPSLFYIGFIPGLLAMVFGNMLSGIGIYKRQTATLFKELEV